MGEAVKNAVEEVSEDSVRELLVARGVPVAMVTLEEFFVSRKQSKRRAERSREVD